MRSFAIATMLTVGVACVGCESTPPQGANRSEASAVPPPQPEAPAEPAPVIDPTVPRGANKTGRDAIAKAAAAMAAKRADEAPATEPAPPADADAPATDEPADNAPADGDTLKKVEVGVGVKGKDYGGPGIVTTPVATMFRAQERIALTQMANAIKIYKAGHNDKGPKSHDEFMDVIIKENAVQLPELPQGDVYWYDVEEEELMVRSPKQES
jgi:hypothetical protein